MEPVQLSSQKTYRPARILMPYNAPGLTDPEIVLQAITNAVRDLEDRLSTIENGVSAGTLNVMPIKMTDHSGSIAAGGAAQQVMPANSTRKFLFIQNISSGLLWINFGTTAVQDEPSIKLMPDSDAFKLDYGTIDTELVSIIGSTTGQKFVAKEGT